MNKEKIYQFSSVSDSSFLYKKKAPKFLYFFIIFILLFLISLITWSNIAIKADVVKQNGIIASENKISLTSNVNSNIEKVNYSEGDFVKSGDVIISLSSSEVDANISQIKTSYDYYLLRTNLFNRLIEYIKNDYSLDEENNSFNQDDINELEFYNYMANYILNKAIYQSENDLAQYKNQTINTYIVQYDDASQKKEQYKSQYEAYLKVKDNYTIKAPIDGYVHFNYNLNNGYFVSTGNELLSISPSNNNLICETYFNSSDYSKIKVGNKVRGAINGLSQNDYGLLEGKLISLASDATNTQDGQIYKGIIKFDTNKISSKRNEVILKPGMSIENRIIYEETTYFKYVLNLWGFNIK